MMKKRFDDDLYQLRMEFAVHNSVLAVDRAIKENRALTGLEDAGVKLALIERDIIWCELHAAARAAGVWVPQWDQDQATGGWRRKRVRLSTEANRIKRLYV